MEFRDLKVRATIDGLGVRWLGPLANATSLWLDDMSTAAYGYLEDCGWGTCLRSGPMVTEGGRVSRTWAKGFGEAARRLAEAGSRAGPESDPEAWASWLAFELAEPHAWLRAKAQGVKTDPAFIDDEIKAVLRSLNQGELPERLPGRGRRYEVAGQSVHVKFQGRTPSKKGGRFIFAINRVTLNSDLAVWICGDRRRWYCVPTGELAVLVETSGAYKGKRTDQTWVVHLDEATHELAYAKGRTADFAPWSRGSARDETEEEEDASEAHLYLRDPEDQVCRWCAHLQRADRAPWFELIDHAPERFTAKHALEVVAALAGPRSVMYPVEAPNGVLADGIRTVHPGEADHFVSALWSLPSLHTRWERVDDWHHGTGAAAVE